MVEDLSFNCEHLSFEVKLSSCKMAVGLKKGTCIESFVLSKIWKWNKNKVFLALIIKSTFLYTFNILKIYANDILNISLFNKFYNNLKMKTYV